MRRAKLIKRNTQKDKAARAEDGKMDLRAELETISRIANGLNERIARFKEALASKN